jgi:hypothetical protein
MLAAQFADRNTFTCRRLLYQRSRSVHHSHRTECRYQDFGRIVTRLTTLNSHLATSYDYDVAFSACIWETGHVQNTRVTYCMHDKLPNV